MKLGNFINFKRRELDFSSMGQWDLIALRFKKHKLAVLSLTLISGMYFVAIFAGFFSVNDPVPMDVNYIYCPPVLPQFSLSRGLYFNAAKQHTDPITLRKYYILDEQEIVPLGFFVRGHEYKLFGVIPSDIHFFGVNAVVYRRSERGKEEFSGELPKLMLLGGDKFGRDIFSRIIIGSRISLSIGIVAIVISFFLGVSIGGISGYFGGRVDSIIQRTIEIINAFPKLPLWLALGAALPSSWSNLQVYFGITLILSFMGWTGMARVVRGKILSLSSTLQKL